MIHIDSVFAMLYHKIPFNVMCRDKWLENPPVNPTKFWHLLTVCDSPAVELQDNCKSSLRMIEYREYMLHCVLVSMFMFLNLSIHMSI